MNHLDIILWASAVGLWVWIIVKICDSFLARAAEQRMLKDNIFNRLAKLESQQTNHEMQINYAINKRLDAIEAKLKKGKR